MKKITALTICAIIFPFISLSSKGYIHLEKNKFSIVCSNKESEQVKRALHDLQRDFQKVLGCTVDITDTSIGKNIEILIISNQTKTKKPNKLKKLDGFESHAIYTNGNKIYLHGDDTRGTIYAIYSFSEHILGVPPLWFYSSWIPEKKDRIEIDRDYNLFVKSPQVRYRAWFPNDKDLLTPWVKISKENNNSFLEAMLRLKLNCIEMEGCIEYPDRISNYAQNVNSFGLINTAHHHTPLNNSLRNWDAYWREMRGTTPPEFLLKNEKELIDFWRYNIQTMYNSKVESLWLIGFRGLGDAPFWATFKDSPQDDKSRGEVINRMLQIQYNLIKEITGNPAPYVRTIFYDELSDMLADGYITPPSGENMIWTYCSARRDHYPNNDLINFDNKKNIKLGYYMNLQFTSTGSHLVQGEGPWKMEFNYRYANSKAPLYFSVVNAGNIREFVLSMSANAQMMWNMDSYNTDNFMLRFCEQYFGKEHAKNVAKLYKDYFYSYWQQKESDFPGGLERQYIFHDMRYARAFEQICRQFTSYTSNPLKDIGFERVKNRSFRIEEENQVDAILKGMTSSISKFEDVTQACSIKMTVLPESNRRFFYDNLLSHSHFMTNLSKAMLYFVEAYKNQGDTRYCIEKLNLSLKHLRLGKDLLFQSQHGAFDNWYKTEHLGHFGIDRIIKRVENVKGLIERDLVAESFTTIEKQMDEMLKTANDPIRVPKSIKPDGTTEYVGLTNWSSGFFAGSLWNIFEYTQDNAWKREAEKWTESLSPIQYFRDHHDVGFMLYTNVGNGYRLTDNPSYKEQLINAANSLASRYIPSAGVIRSWDIKTSRKGVIWHCPVIIDNLMNLELLFAASKLTGNDYYKNIAISHADKTLENHIRSDYSSYHVVNYDMPSGEVLEKDTYQGYSTESTWARGQAWAIYGYTFTYRETGNKKYLNTACKLADYYLNHPNLPSDLIPYWDFNVGEEGYQPDWSYNKDKYNPVPRDASAAAVVASALIELSNYSFENKERYYNTAKSMLKNLATSYMANVGENNGFILKHSVGNMPSGSEIDVPLNYADYYYLEALNKLNNYNK